MTSGLDTGGSSVDVDVVIVGAGPAGLFAAYCAGFRGLSTMVVDAFDQPGGQVIVLYPNKPIYDIAGIPGVTGAQLIDNLLEQCAPYDPAYRWGLKAERLTPGENQGTQRIAFDDGSSVSCRAVILASGVGGIEPRPLPVGHDWLGRGLAYSVTDPTSYADRDVMVVGGGDSALDWALEAAPHARAVTVVHRRRAFRAHAASVKRAVDNGVKLMTDCEIVTVSGDHTIRSVTVRERSGELHEHTVDSLIGALGLISDLGPLTQWGLDMHDRRICVDTSMQTSRAGVFAVGDASWYPGKVALMATGFGEAATAVNNAAVLIDPHTMLAPGHSTDRTLEAVTAREGSLS